MSRFLVTGGAGFIGSNIAKHLLAQGHSVRVLDNFCSGRLENLEFTKSLKKGEFELHRGDITNPTDCDAACKDMDYVLHHAALRSVPGSLKDPLSYNKVNIDGTLYLLQSALKHKIKRFVFASTSAIYGDTNLFPQKEEHMPQLISPYALSKLASEYYCRIFSTIHGLPTVCLRYFNVFGPHQSLDDEYAVVVPKFIHCIVKGEPPPIFGTGLQSRDFVYVDNVVSANILSATHEGLTHEIFNVASGEEHTVLQLVEILNFVMGKNISPKFLPARTGDVFRTVADITRIRQKIGYVPSASFEEGLRTTVEYFKNQF